MSQLNSLRTQKSIKEPVFTAFIVSVCLHGILLIPFWKFYTISMTIPENPMKLVLEMPEQEMAPKSESELPPRPARAKPLKTTPIPKAPVKSIEKQPIKPIEKKSIQEPIEKAPKVSEFPAPVVSENPVVTRQETKPDYAVAEPKSAAVTEMRKAQADTPVGAKIVTAAPNAEVKTEEKAGSGEETKKPSVSTVYLQSIYQKIEKYKRYPRLARDRGIEGSILVEFVLDSNGKLLHNQVLRSSGFKILDREALLTIRRAAPFPKLPAHQMAGQVVLKIPITFELKD